MKIKQFDKSNLESIRQDIESALSGVCKKYGINPTKVGNIRYTADSFSTKLDFNLIRENFNLQVATENPESFMHRKFKMGQRTFTIIEKAQQGKLVGITNRGKRYLLTPAQLLTMREVKF